ncbi:MAG TPA: stalk domain-containing protein [Caldisericia bacterium]|nr:stalk domain-containing protein [Caldisericia bacterium]HPF49128.1 stalk domain-containing protein [Caldisericia bacterium]HPI83008.1 stalk domain-containing protein [Caldisericia bacterium]HPQ92235.1 stalk domain-containing protein [Caldisericia bacterium]HRV74667.1 stalk domain-containing protein [Caldisericia bacterium]
MRKIALLLAIPLLFSGITLTPVAQIDTVEASTTLLVTYSPSILTAGVVPELVDPSTPFTIFISDENGAPVDLTDGGTIEEENIWNSLFVDPHPEELPQYYWTRLDLHNDDGSQICNKTLFPTLRNPIEIDFSRASEGTYVFRGFCANDKGEFDVIVYTPDRKRYGRVTVKVESGIIDYAIWNTEDPDKRIFHTPGDPDFIMTAADNRIYGVVATVKTAEGNLIRGISDTVEICGSYNSSRLTVTTSLLANFYENKATQEAAFDPISGKYIKYISSFNNRYWINLGVDWNNNEKLELSNKEIYEIAGFDVYLPQGDQWVRSGYKTFYNTTNTRWDDGTYAMGYLFDYEDTEVGWGMGCIYNSPYLGCYLLPDLNEDGILNYHDSFSLDLNGSTEFYIFANDVCGITCLLGVNPYGDADLAGGGPRHEEDPNEVEKRYRPDGTFKLDMDAFVAFGLTSGTTTVKKIKINVTIDPETPEVGTETNCRVVVTRIETNKPVHKARVQLSGAGVLETKLTDEYGIADFTFTPTEPKWLRIHVDGGSENGTTSAEFRISKDKTPPELLIDDGIPTLTNNKNFRISGTTEPGAKVTVNNEKATVSESGRFTYDVVLAEGENAINVKAEDASANATRKTVMITLDSKPPELDIDRIDEKYIDATDLTVKGFTNEPCTVSIEGIDGFNSKPVNTSSTFEIKIPVDYGTTSFTIKAVDPAGNVFTKQYKIENYKRTSIIMKVGSKEYLVNGEPKELRFEPFIERGTTLVPVRAISEAFGAVVEYDALTRSIEINLDETQILLQIGINKIIINGVKMDLQVEPIIKNGSTFVPLRAIAEAFDSEVLWASETKEITIERLTLPE